MDQRNTPRATELLRVFQSVSVVTDPARAATAPRFYAVNRRTTGGKACYMDVIIDGQLMPTPFDLEELPSPKELLGMEVYASAASVPVQYAKFGSTCGAILVWTKDTD